MISRMLGMDVLLGREAYRRTFKPNHHLLRMKFVSTSHQDKTAEISINLGPEVPDPIQADQNPLIRKFLFPSEDV
jgi:hypothetical protein